ncbi:MAG: hypothetical protein MI747_13030 [Desulfobacterales bacterium]|nr:hypothetical protein [Desulfobacterales bacterium]
MVGTGPGEAFVILIYDPLCRGLSHVHFNAALVTMTVRAHAGVPVAFMGEESHVQGLAAQLDGETARAVQWISLDPSGLQGSRAQLRQLIPRAPRADLLIMASVDAEFLIFLKLYLALRPRPCLAVLHSRLARIQGWRSRNPLVRMRDMKSALQLKLPRTGLHYLVLEETIAKRLDQILPKLPHPVSVLEHPLSWTSSIQGPDRLSLPLKIGFLGIATPDKGFGDFLHMARAIKKLGSVPVEFHAIGSLPQGFPELDLSALDRIPAQRKLNHDQYTRAMAEMHYICLPYNTEVYALSASGVLLDAVAANIPPIAFPLVIITDLEHRYGPLAHLYSSPEEMAQGIIQLATHPDDPAYQKRKTTLTRIAKDRQMETQIQVMTQLTQTLL